MLRAALAAVLGIVAALLPWTDADLDAASAGELTILWPRGSMAVPPSSVGWTTTVKASRLRLCVRDASGTVWIVRTETIAPELRDLPFSPEERRRLAALASGTIDLSLLSDHGELLAQSPPARFALPDPKSPKSSDGW